MTNLGIISSNRYLHLMLEYILKLANSFIIKDYSSCNEELEKYQTFFPKKTESNFSNLMEISDSVSKDDKSSSSYIISRKHEGMFQYSWIILLSSFFNKF